MHNPLVHLALLIYEGRVQDYRRLKKIDKEIDQHPTAANIREITELRLRNNLAFRELEAFNKTGKFLYRHPLIVNHSERVRLQKLMEDDPEAFHKEFALCQANISRYSSYSRSDKRTDEQRKKDREHMKKHLDREAIFKEIFRK